MRILLITKLAMKWKKDFDSIVEELNREDKIRFTETLLNFTELHKNLKKDYAPIKKIYDEEILKEFGGKIKKAFEIGFWYYYDPILALSSKDIASEEELNDTDIQPMTDLEYEVHLSNIIQSLNATKQHLYLSEPEEPNTDSLEGLSENKVKFTASRQALALHYIFKALEVNDVSYPAKARLIELLTGKSFENILKWVKGTKGKTPKNRNEDLEFIKPYFEDLKLTKIVDFINNDMDPFEKDLKKIKK